jgi:hypothetical protein
VIFMAPVEVSENRTFGAAGFVDWTGGGNRRFQAVKNRPRKGHGLYHNPFDS